MKTKTLYSIFFAGLLVPMSALAAEKSESLYHKEIRAQNSRGEDVVVKVKETHRDARTSMIFVEANATALGSSVGEPMFVMECCRELGKLRGAAYFFVLTETVKRGKTQHLIGFCSDPNVDPTAYFSLEKPLPKERNIVLSVKTGNVVKMAK